MLKLCASRFWSRGCDKCVCALEMGECRAGSVARLNHWGVDQNKEVSAGHYFILFQRVKEAVRGAKACNRGTHVRHPLSLPSAA